MNKQADDISKWGAISEWTPGVMKQNCPMCGAVAYAEGVHNGVGYVYPPLHCDECGWCEKCYHWEAGTCDSMCDHYNICHAKPKPPKPKYLYASKEECRRIYQAAVWGRYSGVPLSMRDFIMMLEYGYELYPAESNKSESQPLKADGEARWKR